MKTRPLEPRDLPAIERMYATSPFCCDWPKWPNAQFEDVTVVVDENDAPVMMCAAVKRVELYLLATEGDPFLKLEALSLLHTEVSRNLVAKGIKVGFARLQPAIARSFGRRLVDLFHWERSEQPVYLIRGER